MTTKNMKIESCNFAGDRFFRTYYKHCIAPDADTLFHLLNDIHSLNDKLKKATGEHFFECHEFIALKALRNLFHHELELVNEVRLIPVNELPPISTDMLYLCLVPSSLVLESFEHIDKKRRVHDEAIIRSTLKWYKNVVNINPCIFNFSVYVFEKFNRLNIKLNSEEYIQFQDSYNFEVEGGYPHFITGDISCHAGSIDEILEIVFADLI